MRLQNKLIVLIGALLLLIIVAFAWFFDHMHAESLKAQIGQRALAVAETVAQIPAVREAFDDPEPWRTIQPLVEHLRVQTGAEYIVVGNRDGIRYSHPLAERIGQEMTGGDNGPVLAGQSIISEAVGSLGPALRGKTPIRDETGRVIGVVSVGFLQADIEQRNEPYTRRILLLSAIALLVGTVGALSIAAGVKRSIFGLEPQEIGRLYQEKQAVLESIREGVLAINQQGVITLANQTAMQMLGVPEGTTPVGRPLTELLPQSRLMDVVRTGRAEYDQEMILGDDIVIVNRVPVVDQRGQVIGAMSSFRNKSELNKITEELSQVKRYAESLRAQTHEFSNKLHTISGLIQLESYQEAIDLISRESDVHQNLVQFLMREVPDPMIGGLLIGKFNRAKELRVELSIDLESSFADIPQGLDRSQLVTILGNLIDNATEAVLSTDTQPKLVRVFLTDIGDDLILEVEDNGPGIADADAERIYQAGWSTKPSREHRGFGLALVRQAVSQLGGYITCCANRPSGTIFTVALPKRAADANRSGGDSRP